VVTICSCPDRRAKGTAHCVRGSLKQRPVPQELPPSPLAGEGPGVRGSARSMRPVLLPSRSCPVPRCIPLAPAGGDLFLPYVKTDPDHQQGQFLITREESPAPRRHRESVRTGRLIAPVPSLCVRTEPTKDQIPRDSLGETTCPVPGHSRGGLLPRRREDTKESITQPVGFLCALVPLW
jgi:hypothetical protein